MTTKIRCPHCGGTDVQMRMDTRNFFVLWCQTCNAHSLNYSRFELDAYRAWDDYCKGYTKPADFSYYPTEPAPQVCQSCGEMVVPGVFPHVMPNGGCAWWKFCPKCFAQMGRLQTKKRNDAVQKQIEQGITPRKKKHHPLAHYGITCCEVCGIGWEDDFKMRKNIHVHHIIPLKRGGMDTDDNLAGVCVKCHKKPEIHRDGKSRADFPYSTKNCGNISKFSPENSGLIFNDEHTFVLFCRFPERNQWGYVVKNGETWTYPFYAETPKAAIRLWMKGFRLRQNYSMGTLKLHKEQQEALAAYNGHLAD